MASSQVQKLEGMDVQNGAIRVTTIKELFEHEHFKDRFLNDVRTEEIVKKLYDAKVIPQRIQRKIERAEDDGDANSILYNHVQPQADMKSAKKLFEIMKAAVTYPEMSQLGAEMLDCFNQNFPDIN